MANYVGRVVIGGGTGFIGSHLSKLLKDNGYDVIIISRMPGPKRLTWTEVTQQGLPDEINAVVNLAGQNVLDPKRRWTIGFRQNVWNSRVKTTQTLANAIKSAKDPPEVFITMSGVGIYQPEPHAEYTEESQCKEFDFLSKLCIEWEKAATLPEDIDCRVVNIRSGVVLGRDGGMIKQLYWPFYFGLGGPIGKGEQYLPWIHVNDLTNLIRYCIENSHVKGIINGVAPQIVTNLDFTKALAKAMWRPAFFPVPSFVLNIIFNEERAKMMTEGQKVIPKKADQIGFKYKYPTIEEACREIVKK